MPVYKDAARGNWYVKFKYKNWRNETKWVTKRGFNTKREASQWELDYHKRQEGNLDMTFADFVEAYRQDRKPRIKESTCVMKDNIIDTKLVPYFGQKHLQDITSKDVIQWQNEMLIYRNPENGKLFSRSYLKTIHNQITAIFNYAVKYYGLKENPCHKAGGMGKKNADEMLFWTKEEFASFIEVMRDRPASYAIFMTLYYTGMREGELLALTPADVDFEKAIITINKSYQRLDGRDIISTPKTPKSNRVVTIPATLCDCLKEYMSHCYGLEDTDRLFPYNKSFLYREMEYGCKASRVKKIRVHDIRHSHASLLVEMVFSPLLIAERLGHERVQTTMETYSHLYPNKQAEVARQLNGIL